MSDNLVTESSRPWIREVLEDTEGSLCSCFLLVSLRCSWAALLTAVLLDTEQLQHRHLGVCIIGLQHSCSGGLMVLPFSRTEKGIYR